MSNPSLKCPVVTGWSWSKSADYVHKLGVGGPLQKKVFYIFITMLGDRELA